MFDDCKDKKEINLLFFRLAKFLHPDHGGENDLMTILLKSRDKAFDIIELKENQDNSKNQKEYSFHERIFGDDVRLEIFGHIEILFKKLKIKLPTFIKSIKEFYKKRGYITEKQHQAVLDLFLRYEKYRDLNEVIDEINIENLEEEKIH